MTITVLVVDDSAFIRQLLHRALEHDGDIAVIGTAADPAEAREMIRLRLPDVVTLDVEMPGMNGLSFLQRLMRLKPLPVVMVSSLTSRGAGETLLALELGAVDFVAKPAGGFSGDLGAFGAELRDKVRTASRADVRSRSPAPTTPRLRTAAGPGGAVIAIGASTGGVEAIRQVLVPLPGDCPPVLIAQHMPAGFTTRFAARLDEVTAIKVVEAEDRMPLATGCAYVAPGDRHLWLERGSGRLKCRLSTAEPVSGHRPSVDVLFASVAQAAGADAVGVILTGMGRDGATGLRQMRAAGAHTIGQDAGSALIYGMPRVAFEEGAVVEQVSLGAISARIAAGLTRLAATDGAPTDEITAWRA